MPLWPVWSPLFCCIPDCHTQLWMVPWEWFIRAAIYSWEEFLSRTLPPFLCWWAQIDNVEGNQKKHICSSSLELINSCYSFRVFWIPPWSFSVNQCQKHLPSSRHLESNKAKYRVWQKCPDLKIFRSLDFKSQDCEWRWASTEIGYSFKLWARLMIGANLAFSRV